MISYFALLHLIFCDKLDDEMVLYTNEYRKSLGLKELKVDPLLVKCSRIQTEYQGKNKVLSHDNTDPGHEKLKDRLQSVGFKFRKGAENVAYSTDINNPKATKSTFDRLCASKGHHDNIVGDFDYIGVTNTIGKDGARYTTQVFGSKFDITPSTNKTCKKVTPKPKDLNIDMPIEFDKEPIGPFDLENSLPYDKDNYKLPKKSNIGPFDKDNVMPFITGNTRPFPKENTRPFPKENIRPFPKENIRPIDKENIRPINKENIDLPHNHGHTRYIPITYDGEENDNKPLKDLIPKKNKFPKKHIFDNNFSMPKKNLRINFSNLDNDIPNLNDSNYGTKDKHVKKMADYWNSIY